LGNIFALRKTDKIPDRYMKLHLLYLLLALTTTTLPSAAQSVTLSWQKLNTEEYPGKQDDIYFTDENTGWYVNGSGKIWHTSDGGNTWSLQLEQKGTFFRCLAFTDSLHGFAGTVGTEYYKGVTDTISLYSTQDGGRTWAPQPYTGPYVKGLCGMDVVKEIVNNHGEAGYRYHIYCVGRVGSPASYMVSHDDGKTFTSMDMSPWCGALYDVKFLDTDHGFACASTSGKLAESHASIMRTKDGGRTWKKVYQSKRRYENCWKMQMVNGNIGYATLQSYNPDTTQVQQRFIKTTDGGKRWKEGKLCSDYRARSFGVGFADTENGFIGTLNTGYQTHDGGKSWTPVNLGRACNKIRMLRDPGGKLYGYAIGVDVYKLKVDHTSLRTEQGQSRQ